MYVVTHSLQNNIIYMIVRDRKMTKQIYKRIVKNLMENKNFGTWFYILGLRIYKPNHAEIWMWVVRKMKLRVWMVTRERWGIMHSLMFLKKITIHKKKLTKLFLVKFDKEQPFLFIPDILFPYIPFLFVPLNSRMVTSQTLTVLCYNGSLLFRDSYKKKCFM